MSTPRPIARCSLGWLAAAVTLTASGALAQPAATPQPAPAPPSTAPAEGTPEAGPTDPPKASEVPDAPVEDAPPEATSEPPADAEPPAANATDASQAPNAGAAVPTAAAETAGTGQVTAEPAQAAPATTTAGEAAPASQTPQATASTETTAKAEEPADPPPPLHPTRFNVGLGMQAAWRHDRGYERVGGQTTVQFHGLIGADVWRMANLVLATEVDVEVGRQQGSNGLGSGDAELASQSFVAALVPRIELTPWLWPHLRVGVGALRSQLRLTPPEGSVWTDDDWGYAVDLAAGVSFALPRELRKRRLRAQPLLRIEGGYRFAPDAEFGTQGNADGGIPVQRADLGKLARGAALVRLSVGVRF